MQAGWTSRKDEERFGESTSETSGGEGKSGGKEDERTNGQGMTMTRASLPLYMAQRAQTLGSPFAVLSVTRERSAPGCASAK